MRAVLSKPPAPAIGRFIMKNNSTDIPISEKYTLSIAEAAAYFRIGEDKLRRLSEGRPTPAFVLMNGNRIQIKRKLFEKVIDELDAI